jgi:hypothetical protein
MPWDDTYARHQVVRAEELLSGLDALPDGVAAARATETVRTLVALYGDCLARVMAHLTDDPEPAGQEDDRREPSGPPGRLGGSADAVVRRLAADELVGHLLLVHDLHPDPVETRVRDALADPRARLEARGGALELLELSDTAVRIRLRDGGGGCGGGRGRGRRPE